ncbi:hypothetical protein HHK36_025592 [Tetracentron sinense]|uniref:Protein EARLY FLOWERING 3 n=1 Tax=Tetracentron sinense TaxID=13715 RepID=A0A834YNH4_TETSI|nr:hypothetical protein HHK36_025592 [Tetracentron sinense]
MKEGKDEKIKGPLFPRLHVNDTEKGGPRAPPRNKMALYEQLSIPSQRFNSGSAKTLPPPPNNTSNLIPPTSSSQEGGHGRSVVSPSYVPPPSPAHLSEKFHSDGVNSNTTMEAFERKSMKTANYLTSNATWHLPSTTECRSFYPRDFSNSKKSSMKKHGDEEDLRVPTFVHSRITPCYSKDQQSINRERHTSFSPTHPGSSKFTPWTSPLKNVACIPSMQLKNARDKQLKLTDTIDLKSRQNVINQSEEKIAVPLKHANVSLNQERRSSLADDFGILHDSDARKHREYRAGFLPENTVSEDGVSVEPMQGMGKGNASWARSESCFRASLEDSYRSPNEDENGGEYSRYKAHESLQVGDVDRNDDVSETSIVDSISGLDISPDDVVEVIGQKHFWKARREIVKFQKQVNYRHHGPLNVDGLFCGCQCEGRLTVMTSGLVPLLENTQMVGENCILKGPCQQRAFAMQVFELHRLIKVQRLFAGSPHLLLEDDPYLVKPSLKVSPMKKLSSEYVLKLPPPQVVKQKEKSQKPNQSTECASENALVKLPLPSLNNGISQRSNYGPHSANPPPVPVATDTKAGPWCCYPPPENQWLVPVMSPSEGLIYKPYTGSCPPVAGFMAPVYGGYGPLSLPPMAGNFLNTGYGVPASHQQGMGVLPGSPPVGQSYFPPYGMPVINPAISGSTVEQMSSFSGAWPHGQADLSMGATNFNMPYQSSCNMSIQKSGAVSGCVGKFQTSKDSELQGSTASSTCVRAPGAVTGHVAEGRDSLPLFPMAPAVQLSDQPLQTHSSDQSPRAIRVVPHNPRSATESAARIFRSIQEERKQYDAA